MHSTTQSHIQADQWLDIEPRRTATILQVIFSGWEIARKRPDVRPGTCENPLNECLREGMKAAVNREAPRGKMPKMHVLGTTMTRSSSAVSEPDGAPDIPVNFPKILESTHDHGPHACIECKRIDGTGRRCRAYVEDGVDRFKSGKYGARHRYGFMAAYLDSGDTNVAVTAINKFLDNKRRQDEYLGPAVVSDAEWVRSSQHARSGGNAPIEIHHVFLAFR